MFRTFETRDNVNGEACTKEEYDAILNKLKSFTTTSLNLENVELSFRDFKILYPEKNSDFYLNSIVNKTEKLPTITFDYYTEKMKNIYHIDKHQEFFDIVKLFF